MRYLLLAPVHTEFSLVSESPIRDPDRYRSFWDTASGLPAKQRLRRRLPAELGLSPELEELRFAHASPYHKNRFNRYRSLRSDSLERPMHVLEIELDGRTLPERLSTAMPAAYVARSVIWRIFDHQICLLEVDIDLADHLDRITEKEHIPTALGSLQQTGIELADHIAAWAAEELLPPIFNFLEDLEGNETYLELGAHTDRARATGAVLWVTRTLIFETADKANRERIVREWLKDTVHLSDENGQTQVDHVACASEAHLTSWLNYLFRENSYERLPEAQTPTASQQPSADKPPPLARPFCDVWEAMLYAQFFYGALDLVDGRLTAILAESLARTQKLPVTELKARLERNIDKANLLLLQRHDSSKYYKRTVKATLDDILEGWDFETVLIEPVKHKIEVCQKRLNLLHQKEVSRSGIYTDLILISLGITSIFGMSLALAEYGRTMANDPDLASYDVTSAYAIDWFAALPTDIILTWAGILSLTLVGVYVYYRRHQIS